MTIVDRYTLAARRLEDGHDLTTTEAAMLLAVCPRTLLRHLQEQGRMPTQPAQGRRPAYWSARDIQALLVRVEVSHAQAS